MENNVLGIEKRKSKGPGTRLYLVGSENIKQPRTTEWRGLRGKQLERVENDHE